jgi:hypothetical protein
VEHLPGFRVGVQVLDREPDLVDERPSPRAALAASHEGPLFVHDLADAMRASITARPTRNTVALPTHIALLAALPSMRRLPIRIERGKRTPPRVTLRKERTRRAGASVSPKRASFPVNN